MPKAHRTSYNLAFKLKIIPEAEAVKNNSEITREYGISKKRSGKAVQWRTETVSDIENDGLLYSEEP